MALTSKNVSYCDYIQPRIKQKDRCIITVAYIKRDAKTCSLITGENPKQNCIQWIAQDLTTPCDYDTNPCDFLSFATGLDQEVCANITGISKKLKPSRAMCE